MAFTDAEQARYEKLIADYVENRRPSEAIRDQLDLAYRIEGQSVVIFEIRPLYFDPQQKIESPIAKTTFVRKRKHWAVFWMRRDLKWHRYDPQPTVASLAEFLELVDDDPICCFWG